MAQSFTKICSVNANSDEPCSLFSIPRVTNTNVQQLKNIPAKPTFGNSLISTYKGSYLNSDPKEGFVKVQKLKNIPAQPTFGLFYEPQDAGEYILNKKAKTSICGLNVCATQVKSQSNLLLLKKSKYLNYYKGINNINTTNLNMNLITKLNLTDVNVLQPVDMSLNVIPYKYYTIDPSGELFGLLFGYFSF
jgi:hypothetical protein